ncbi:Tubby-related protein 1 [Anopheles sinensis]|uniref:Tubby-related protein 1 n=1 Tax=Anopheles sinensis TaxID=74873 RepID=A0A084VAS9_ANOSI|nr:Tubby-related protein 1 [Anopheles sinensis]
MHYADRDHPMQNTSTVQVTEGKTGFKNAVQSYSTSEDTSSPSSDQPNGHASIRTPTGGISCTGTGTFSRSSFNEYRRFKSTGLGISSDCRNWNPGQNQNVSRNSPQAGRRARSRGTPAPENGDQLRPISVFDQRQRFPAAHNRQNTPSLNR